MRSNPAGRVFVHYLCIGTLEAYHTDGVHQAPWKIMLLAVVLLQLSLQPASTAAPSPTLSWRSSCFDCATSTIRSLQAMEVVYCIVQIIFMWLHICLRAAAAVGRVGASPVVTTQPGIGASSKCCWIQLEYNVLMLLWVFYMHCHLAQEHSRFCNCISNPGRHRGLTSVCYTATAFAVTLYAIIRQYHKQAAAQRRV